MDTSFENRIHFQGAYIVPEDEREASRLVVESPWRREYATIMVEHGVQGLTLNDTIGWPGDDISFLSSIPHLRRLDVYSRSITDLSLVYGLQSLEELGIDCRLKQPLDLTRFSCLRSFFARWTPKLKSVWECDKLTRLILLAYPSETLDLLHELANLKELGLDSRSLRTTRGIETCANIETFRPALCTKLEDLAGMETLDHLRLFDMASCKKVSDISPLDGKSSIRDVQLRDCGVIKSLKPLVSCKNLERLDFVGTTKIEDGDLSLAWELPQLRFMHFQDRRHYSHKWEEIQEMIKERAGSD